MGLTQKKIVLALDIHHNIRIRLRNLQRILQRNNLYHRKNYTDINDILRFITNELNGSGKLHGYRWMFEKCKLNGIRVRKEHVRHFLSILDPEGVYLRHSNRLHSSKYFSRGPNYIWHCDSYDKLKPFGICINGCVDGYSRKVVWLNAYNTSSDPRIIGGYFVEAVKELHGYPMIIRSDKGTENNCVRHFQQFLRRYGNDPYSGERSFMYGRSTSNQRIESWWGFLRRECIDFWLDILHGMKNEGHFDSSYLDKNLVIFCFISLIQVSYNN